MKTLKIQGQLLRTVFAILESDSDFKYISLSVKGGDAVPRSESTVVISYINMVYEYLLSGVSIRDELKLFAKNNPDIDIDVITPKTEYMKKF